MWPGRSAAPRNIMTTAANASNACSEETSAVPRLQTTVPCAQIARKSITKTIFLGGGKQFHRTHQLWRREMLQRTSSGQMASWRHRVCMIAKAARPTWRQTACPCNSLPHAKTMDSLSSTAGSVPHSWAALEKVAMRLTISLAWLTEQGHLSIGRVGAGSWEHVELHYVNIEGRLCKKVLHASSRHWRQA